MTKEELKKEAINRVDAFIDSFSQDIRSTLYDRLNQEDVKDFLYSLYIDSAEPREKQIEELKMALGSLRTFSNEQAISIEKLKEENTELKDNLEIQKKTVVEMVMPALDRTIKQRTQAEEIIKNSIVLLTKSRTALDTKTYLMKAEQFLQETDINNAIQKAHENLDLDKIADKVEQDLNESCPDVLCKDCNKEDCIARKLGLIC